MIRNESDTVVEEAQNTEEEVDTEAVIELAEEIPNGGMSHRLHCRVVKAFVCGRDAEEVATQADISLGLALRIEDRVEELTEEEEDETAGLEGESPGVVHSSVAAAYVNEKDLEVLYHAEVEFEEWDAPAVKVYEMEDGRYLTEYDYVTEDEWLLTDSKPEIWDLDYWHDDFEAEYVTVFVNELSDYTLNHNITCEDDIADHRLCEVDADRLAHGRVSPSVIRRFTKAYNRPQVFRAVLGDGPSRVSVEMWELQDGRFAFICENEVEITGLVKSSERWAKEAVIETLDEYAESEYEWEVEVDAFGVGK